MFPSPPAKSPAQCVRRFQIERRLSSHTSNAICPEELSCHKFLVVETFDLLNSYANSQHLLPVQTHEFVVDTCGHSKLCASEGG